MSDDHREILDKLTSVQNGIALHAEVVTAVFAKQAETMAATFAKQTESAIDKQTEVMSALLVFLQSTNQATALRSALSEHAVEMKGVFKEALGEHATEIKGALKDALGEHTTEIKGALAEQTNDIKNTITRLRETIDYSITKSTDVIKTFQPSVDKLADCVGQRVDINARLTDMDKKLDSLLAKL